jgi:opacity protein-like surface antigen
MKYYTLIFVFFSLICPPLIAQKGSLYYAVNIGMNASAIRYVKNYPSTDSGARIRTSNRYGLGIKYELLKNLRIGAECSIEEKGWLLANSGGISNTGNIITNTTSNYNYRFVSFPLTIDYSLKVDWLKLFVEGGYLINIFRNPLVISIDNVPGAVPFLYTDGAPMDYSWMYGGGIEVSIYDKLSISLKRRYDNSYTSIGTWGIGLYLKHYNVATLLQLSYKLDKRTAK